MSEQVAMSEKCFNEFANKLSSREDECNKLRRINAALLAACKFMVRWFDEGKTIDDDPELTIQVLRDAITQAEGSQSKEGGEKP